MSIQNALKWSFLSELAARIVAPVVFIVLARLLTPEDFGVIAAALVVISFSQVFWEAGMGKAIIQYQGDRATAANAAFWINGALALVVAAILVAVAGAVAGRVFHDERVALVLQVMALQVVLSAAVSVHTALLQKDMQFKPLFWVRLATGTIPGLISIPLALYGMGYWALIAGTLIGQFVQVVMLWRMSEWRPEWSFNVVVARKLGGFGAWVAVSGLLGWFYIWADALIVGLYLGSHELGLFRTGNQLAMMIFAVLFAPILPVLYSHLSTMNEDRERLRMAIEKVIKILALVAIPIAFITFSLAEPIAVALLGEKWRGIELVIGVMALAHGFSWVISMNGEVYRAMAKPHYETLAMAATLPIYLAFYLIAIQHGLDIFLWTRLTLVMAAMVLQLVMLRTILAFALLPFACYTLKITTISFIVVAAVSQFVQQAYTIAWQQLLAIGVLDVLLVGSVVLLLERKGIVREIVELIGSRKP